MVGITPTRYFLSRNNDSSQEVSCFGPDLGLKQNTIHNCYRQKTLFGVDFDFELHCSTTTISDFTTFAFH